MKDHDNSTSQGVALEHLSETSQTCVDFEVFYLFATRFFMLNLTRNYMRNDACTVAGDLVWNHMSYAVTPVSLL